MIKKIIVGPLQANCYVVYHNESLEAFIVDPGSDYKKISRFLKDNQLKLQGILLTHGHYDHIGATNAFLVNYPNLPIYIHEDDVSFLMDPSKNLSSHYSHDLCIVKPKQLIPLKDEQLITIANYKVCCRHYPGHTPGACMFFVEELNAIFSGDVLFSKSIGRFDLPYGNRSDTILSLRKIKQIQTNYDVYPGHENKTTIHDELAQNPYLLSID